MKKLTEWLKTLFLEEYELTVWYKGGTDFDPKTTKRVYRMKSISKKTQTHFKGTQTNGKSLEIKTTSPFDYQIEKLY